MSSPESHYLSLTTEKGHIEPSVAAKAFSALKSITADFMTGEWQGFDLNTGHPTAQKTVELHWAGKTFRGVDDVDPIVVYDQTTGERKWNADWGHAQLREISFEGQNTTAMVYDDFPIIDYFHYVSKDLVAGAMDSKKMKPFGTYYFYLKRIYTYEYTSCDRDAEALNILANTKLCQSNPVLPSQPARIHVSTKRGGNSQRWG